ncbi:hypothetical protein SLA2020_151990 [Shorea laevis]
MGFFTLHQLAFVFGLLGNIVSFLVFLAPVPTFYTIWKKKTSEGFQSLPYVIALSSAMLLLYYGFIKERAYLIISINSIGCAIEVTYLIFYIIYAPRREKIFTMKLILFFNIGSYASMMILTNLLLDGPKRVAAIGWTCAAFNIGVFAAPLSIMRHVVRTRSVEYMPFTLSFFLTLCATMWFFYGLFVKDLFIAAPNVLGFSFGIAQMTLYVIYKDASKDVATKTMQPKEGADVQLRSMEMGVHQQETKDNKLFIYNKPTESNQNNIV